MQSVLVGMFDTRAAAEQARTQLTAAGFAPDAVSMHPDASGPSTTAGTSSSTSSASSSAPEHEGVISRFFHSMFGNDDAPADRDTYDQSYSEAFRRGAYGVTVRTSSDDETDRAAELLNSAGAVDIDERAQQWRNEGWTGGGSAAATGTDTGARADLSSAATDTVAGGTQKLQEVEERLVVGKRAVAKGGVRVFSRVVEVPVEESVRLREETANIQRRTVDRAATDADMASLKDVSIEVRESSEEAVVGKTARVVGEVEVGKVVTERDETVRDTVRKTQVDIEQIEGSERTMPSIDRKI